MSEAYSHTALAADIKQLIESAKQRAAIAVNAELTALYWQVGKRIADELLQGERGDYGKRVISNLSKQLTVAFGKGWSSQQLHHCLRFAETFPDQQIVSAMRRQLSWTHLKGLIYIEDALKREFYLRMAIEEHWTTRVLAERIDSQLFERTAISKKPEQTIAQELQLLKEKGEVTQSMVLKDPYVLDFLELNDHCIEKDLEDAIVRELDSSGIHVAEYLTALPPKKLLEQRLHKAIENAKQRFEKSQGDS